MIKDTDKNLQKKDIVHTVVPKYCNLILRYGGGYSTTAEEVSRFQCLFPNPNWLV